MDSSCGVCFLGEAGVSGDWDGPGRYFGGLSDAVHDCWTISIDISLE